VNVRGELPQRDARHPLGGKTRPAAVAVDRAPRVPAVRSEQQAEGGEHHHDEDPEQDDALDSSLKATRNHSDASAPARGDRLAPTVLFGLIYDSLFILGIGLLCSVFDLAYIGLLIWAKRDPSAVVTKGDNPHRGGQWGNISPLGAESR
jgi:hypothetical protein